MIGSIIGGAMKIGSSIFGGIQASKAMKKVQQNLKDRVAENQAWYDRRYNEDATQRADAQRILAYTEEAIRNRNREAAAAQAVAGGTEEALAATKAANNEALSNAASQITMAGERRKDNIEAQYRATDSALDDELNRMQLAKAGEIAKAVGGVGDAAAGIASSF